MLLKIPQEEAGLSWELSVTKILCSGTGLEQDQDFSSLEVALTVFGKVIPSLSGSYPSVIWTKVWCNDRVSTAFLPEQVSNPVFRLSQHGWEKKSQVKTNWAIRTSKETLLKRESNQRKDLENHVLAWTLRLLLQLQPSSTVSFWRGSCTLWHFMENP